MKKESARGSGSLGAKALRWEEACLVCLKNSNKIHVSDGNEEKQEMRWENWEVHSLIYPSLHSPNE